LPAETPSIFEDKVSINDSEYRKLLDGLARFYNSQVTAHVGYVLTSIVGYFALFSVASANKWFEWISTSIIKMNISGYVKSIGLSVFVSAIRFFGLDACVSFCLFVGLGLVYVFCLPSPLSRISPKYLFARLQYYMVLSEVVWNHLGLTEQTGTEMRLYMQLRDRAFRLREREPNKTYSLGIHTAVVTFFEARLYVSCRRRSGQDYELNDEEKDIFGLKEYYSDFTLGTSYQTGKRLGWYLLDLLMLAHGETLARHLADKTNMEGLDYKIASLFEDYL
jgi:hypothetical protein